MVVSTMFDRKKIQFGIMVFLEVQAINLQGNMRGSKCHKYYIFLWKLFRFAKKFLSFDSVAFFEIFLPQLPVMFSSDLN